MKKILWFCNIELSEVPIKQTGTWLISMMNALLELKNVQLYNITQKDVKKVSRKDYKNVSQWILPIENVNKKGLPSKKTLRIIQKLEREIQPDLIHIWGTEGYWGMLSVHQILKTKHVLLDTQGILTVTSQVFWGGLNQKEIRQCVSFKEWIFPKKRLSQQKKQFEKRGKKETLILKHLEHISVQSDWVKSYVSFLHPECNIQRTNIILREEFYKAKIWEHKETDKPILFASSASLLPYKGLHVLIRATALLKRIFPNIELRIAGGYQASKIRQDGYTRWLNKEIKKLGLQESVKWLGKLDASEITQEMLDASVSIIPSYIETYSLALAESMMIGIPTVVSYAGAMPERARHEDSALYFPIGDEISCAYQIQRILESKSLAEKLSHQAKELASKRNDPDTIIAQQIKIYESIFNQKIFF